MSLREGRRHQPLSIVVCDDNTDIADSLSALLVACGYRVATTYCGREAIGAAEKLHPDVAFLDIGLPDVDGYEVAKGIRALPFGSRVKLIAITGYGAEAAREKAREAGFNLYFTKPVDFLVLERVLDAAA